jgi:hypothetical protein
MNRIGYVVAVVAVGMLGCGGGDLCSRPSPCANDVMSTPSQIDQCKATLDANKSATCYNEIINLLTCSKNNVVCTAGNTTDPQLTATKTANNCRNQLDAANSCCMGNPQSTACQ